ncbi:unnamed protein product [Leptidea sinapis]|uniref:Uncharacterized protein n=1 Tax=Leptidea sinapis TaxID=189913 RepID=A0A5E4PM35_9NEOP|nr:unnamed protein product [Leptidea sinapis]
MSIYSEEEPVFEEEAELLVINPDKLPKEGDFVLVLFKVKSKNIYYIAKVIGEKSEETERAASRHVRTLQFVVVFGVPFGGICALGLRLRLRLVLGLRIRRQAKRPLQHAIHAVETVGGLHARHEQQSAERDLTFRHEVGPANNTRRLVHTIQWYAINDNKGVKRHSLGERRGGVLREAFVELVVLVRRHFGRFARPDRLVIVHQLPIPHSLLRFLYFFLFCRIFHLRVFVVIGGGGGVDRLLHVDGLGARGPQVDGEVNELRVLLDERADGVRLQVVGRLLLEMQRKMCAALQRVSPRVFGHAERAGVRRPYVLPVVVVLRHHRHSLRHQERRVEAHTELPDHEVSSARLRDGAQVVDEVVLCHADAGVDDVKQPLLGLGLDADAELRVALQHAASTRDDVGNVVYETLYIRVDDELHHAVDLGLEGIVLRALANLSLLRHAQLVGGNGFLLTQHGLRICKHHHS